MSETKSRVLYVHSSSELWGSDRCLYHMLAMIDKDKYEPSVILPCPGPLSGRIEALGVEVIYPPCMSIIRRFRNPLQYVAYFFKLAVEVIWLVALLQRRRVDILHVNTSALIGPLMAGRLCRVPTVCHLREIRVSPRFVGRILVTTINLLADHVITISQAVAEFARSGWVKPRSLEIVHDGLDSAPRLGASPADPLHPNIPPERIVISTIGRITYWKGTHVFLEAAQRVLKDFSQAHFLIVGDSDTKHAAKYQKQLEDTVADAGIEEHIGFTGFVVDIGPILARTDVLVLPSVYPEPFGMVVIEAMREGIPVIATRHGGPLDIIREGREGLFVTPDDPLDLAQKIVLLAANPQLRAEMGARARQRVVRRFHICETMTSIHKTYEKVVI